MLKKLRLERFKNFRDAELQLGPLTLLIGENATGKSNVRDAFRFLHGISRGYSVAEVFGEKWGDGGVLQWKGVRGGARDATFEGASTFALEIDFALPDDPLHQIATYRIEIDVGRNGQPARVTAERLSVAGQVVFAIPVPPEAGVTAESPPAFIWVPAMEDQVTVAEFLDGRRSVLPEVANRIDLPALARGYVRNTLRALDSLRFLEFDPDAMRSPSFPGQSVLGDRGENLSSVLQAICEDPSRKAGLLDWVQDLTPMDATDFTFPPDQIGRVLLTLVEENGQQTTAYSASDGTLRLLAMIAALLGSDGSRLHFFEEIENGIHPTRLYLLLRLIEQRAKDGAFQVVATTHSPGLLREFGRSAIDYASVTYRLRGQREAHISRIVDIPDARRLIESDDIARLHESGWFEDVVAFMQDEDARLVR